MLAEKMRDLELAVDEAKAAASRLDEIKTAAQARVDEAKSVAAKVATEAKTAVTTAEQALAAASQKVNALRDDVRVFLNEMYVGGRVRQ